MPEAPAIRTENVSFAYNSVRVLEDVTLTIPSGALMSIVGPNGGGKTTLIKLFLGLISPDRGSVTVFGCKPARVREQIGYMPQHPRFDPKFPITVEEVVVMGRVGGHFLGRYSREDRQVAHHALTEVDMGQLARHQFSELSGGQRQRVMMARALACEPDILLLDEPTANIDPSSEKRFCDIIRGLSERMTVLIASHDLGLVSEVVSSVICVNRQVVVHPTHEITGELIQDIYGEGLRAVCHTHTHAQQEESGR